MYDKMSEKKLYKGIIITAIIIGLVILLGLATTGSNDKSSFATYTSNKCSYATDRYGVEHEMECEHDYDYLDGGYYGDRYDDYDYCDFHDCDYYDY